MQCFIFYIPTCLPQNVQDTFKIKAPNPSQYLNGLAPKFSETLLAFRRWSKGHSRGSKLYTEAPNLAESEAPVRNSPEGTVIIAGSRLGSKEKHNLLGDCGEKGS